MTPDGPVRSDPWADAVTAAHLLAMDPEGLKGVILRALPGAARDAWLEIFGNLIPEGGPLRRAPAHIDDERLLGGLDLAATLAAGRPVASRGLLSESDGGVVVLAMAERCSSATGARIAMAMDAGAVGEAAARFTLVALDEGIEPEERAPDCLAERVAFQIDFEGVRISASPPVAPTAIVAARKTLARMAPADDALIEGICEAAAAFGVGSTRAALFLLRASRAAAALAGRSRVEEEDLALAARLVLAPRARMAPAQSESEPAPPPPQEGDDAPSAEEQSQTDAPADRLVEAVQSALPAEFLAQFLEARAERRTEARARGMGAAAKSARRGRPLGARAGALRTGDRLDLVATLRAAAPWQPMRRRDSIAEARVLVRREDFRVRRFVQRLESTTIVVVDASGSAALQRLAEAKGAVETLLAEAYVSRARVALIAFRNTTAELLLPPTRSLSRAKRSLAELPGGGATPLATAIDCASVLAQSERAKGRTPLIVLLTDGRGNVGRDGEVGRPAAEADALAAARAVRAAALSAVFIDTAPRPRPDAGALAREMGAAYAPLPFVDAGAVAGVVRAHAPTRR
jgi:magnesium chelatase subunit D